MRPVSGRKPPWKRPKPKTGKKRKTLTPAQKAAARARAAAAGRRYPNLVDNMWAARLPNARQFSLVRE
ncbi:MAG: hypothetical protein KDK07_12590 [Bauldia sp.]|nr:hypothetical protein [Bauldia sp.]